MVTDRQRRALLRAEIEQGEQPKAAFRLRDYLSPGNKYPYEDLPNDLEAALAAGHRVYLFSVPGFMMISGWPVEEGDEDPAPWHKCDFGDEYYGTAREALRA